MFSYLNIANCLLAIIAPTIGAIIGMYYSWKTIFLVLFSFAMLNLMYTNYFYIETAPKKGNAKKLS